MSVSKLICTPGSQEKAKFNEKKLFRVIQGHSFGDHRKAVEGLHAVYIS